jgi:hypothetical protein
VLGHRQYQIINPAKELIMEQEELFSIWKAHTVPKAPPKPPTTEKDPTIPGHGGNET